MLANGISDWEPDRETSIAPQPLKITSLQPSLEAGQACVFSPERNGIN